MFNVTILWGTSGFWEWLAEFWLKKFKNNIEVTITGVQEQKAQEVAHRLDCKYSLDNKDAVKDADIVIFAVPIAYTQSVIQEIGPHIKSWAIIADVTSIKWFPADAMYESVSDDILVIPTHPMFGPYITSLASQIIVLTPQEKDKKDLRYQFLKNFLESQGAKVIETSTKEHDTMMAVVQWLTHFNMFVLWETLQRLNINIQKSMDFVSPIYKLMISSVARYMNQNPKLYGDIQMYNPEVLEVHKAFMETTNTFNVFVKEKDEESFIQTIESTQKYFWEDALHGQQYTDKVIHLITKQSEKAEKNIWKEVTLINIYNEQEVHWILQSFNNNTLHINNQFYPIDVWEII